MEMPYVFPLGEGLELTQMERNEEQLIFHVRATSSSRSVEFTPVGVSLAACADSETGPLSSEASHSTRCPR